MPVGSPELIAGRIEEAYARRGEIGERARQAIERSYSERAVGAQLAAMLRAVAERSERSAVTYHAA